MKIHISGIQSERVEAIVFDLGGVVLDVDFQRSLAAFGALHIGKLNAGDILAEGKSCFQELELGLIDPHEFLDALRLRFPALASVCEEAVWTAWTAMLCPFDPARVALVRELAKQCRVYLLSNTNLPHRICFREMFAEQVGGNFDDLFIRCFYSDELHLRKPDPEIYRRVASEIGLAPEKLLFIDDNGSNIAQARAEGWQTCHLAGNMCITDLFES